MKSTSSSTDHKVNIKVIKHLALGLQVEMDKGQRGIIRIREISWDDGERLNWKKIHPVGWNGQAVLLGQKDSQYIELSLRLADNDPWLNLPESFEKDGIYEGIVAGVVDYGVFIELAVGLTGLLHQSNFSAWIKTTLLDLFWPGDRVRVIIQSVDRQQRHISLGLPPLVQIPNQEASTKNDERISYLKSDASIKLDEFLKQNTTKKHFLIVEDEPEQSRVASIWLQQIGQRVDVVENAEKALDFIEQVCPDIALIDVGLPGMDGIELAKIIMERWPQVKIVSTTDWARADEIMEKLNNLQTSGADLLIKPLLLEDFVDVLKKAGEKLDPVVEEKTAVLKMGLVLSEIPRLKSDSTFRELLGRCRRHLEFEQAILFSFDSAHRTVSIVERLGDVVFNKNAIPSLIFSPVRDVAEDKEVVIIDECLLDDQARFRYLSEFTPMVACVGFPISARLPLNYALFLLDRHPRKITKEDETFVEAIALACGAILEQNDFKEKSMLIQRTALIGHLTRAMVHEINNLVGPLSSRIENLQFRLEALDKATNQTNIQETKDQLIHDELIDVRKNVRKIINTTRMFGRIAARSKSEILRVDEIINETIQLLQDTSDRAHVNIIFNPPEQLLVIRTQGAALEQVLLNVILNAVQQIAEFRTDLGGWVRIYVDLEYEATKSNFFRILIEDNGPGIHASLCEKIFEVGFTTRHDGSGIGLYISRNLVEEIGCKLYVQKSFILGGTTFALEIPRHL